MTESPRSVVRVEDLKGVAIGIGETFLKIQRLMLEQGENPLNDPRLASVLKENQVLYARILRERQILGSDGKPITTGKANNEPRFGSEVGELSLAANDKLNTSSIIVKRPIGNLQQLQLALGEGVAGERFPVGTVFADMWTDIDNGKTYEMPLRLVDYRKVTLASGEKRMGAVLLRVNAVPHWIEFGRKKSYPDSDVHFWLQEGYAQGCSEELLQVVTPIVLEDMGGLEVKFFLPRVEELHLDPDKNPALEKLVWEFYANMPTDCEELCEERVFLDLSGEASECWTRSFQWHEPMTIWTDGTAYGFLSRDNLCVPACVII